MSDRSRWFRISTAGRDWLIRNSRLRQLARNSPGSDIATSVGHVFSRQVSMAKLVIVFMNNDRATPLIKWIILVNNCLHRTKLTTKYSIYTATLHTLSRSFAVQNAISTLTRDERSLADWSATCCVRHCS